MKRSSPEWKPGAATAAGRSSRAFGLAALDLPQAKRLSEKDNWDLSLIDEIQKSGFLDQLY